LTQAQCEIFKRLQSENEKRTEDRDKRKKEALLRNQALSQLSAIPHRQAEQRTMQKLVDDRLQPMAERIDQVERRLNENAPQEAGPPGANAQSAPKARKQHKAPVQKTKVPNSARDTGSASAQYQTA